MQEGSKMTLKQGLLITMEGPDGSGKTLQMDLLEKALREQGYPVIRSREPGGTRIGEAIRSVILNPEYTEMDQMTEAMLYAASRAQHVAEKIKPAMAEGYIVLLDRFLDSSLVYQGIARGMTIETIEAINQFATGGLQPDATIMVYIDYEEGLRRKKQQNGSLDRMEAEQDNFHRRVNEGYLQLAHRYPERIQLIDGARDPQTIHQDILKRVQDLVQARA